MPSLRPGEEEEEEVEEVAEEEEEEEGQGTRFVIGAGVNGETFATSANGSYWLRLVAANHRRLVGGKMESAVVASVEVVCAVL